MKFYGNIGFAVTQDMGDDVWKEIITDKKYAGDVFRLQRNRDSGEHINDGLRINTQISVLMDPWFHDHLSGLRYVDFCGSKWIAESVDVNYPRVNITLGGLYHGNEPEEEPEVDPIEETEGNSGDE